MGSSARTRKSPIPRIGAARPSGREKERVLIEFPSTLLKRADEAARELDTNRSGLIRNAVERLLDEMEAKEFESVLARAYTANSDLNRALAAEFAHVDREGIL